MVTFTVVHLCYLVSKKKKTAKNKENKNSVLKN